MENTDLMLVDGKQLSSYFSKQLTTVEEKKDFYNLTSNPDHKLSDYINKTINVVDVFAEEIEVVNEDTGEVQIAPRVILIDDKGESYACVSAGIKRALHRMFSVFGAPTWPDGVTVEVLQIECGSNNRTFTLKVV